MLISLLALLFLLLLDMWRSSCETSFPRFGLSRHVLTACLPWLLCPRASVHQALPSHAPVRTCSTSSRAGSARPLPVLSNGLPGHRDWLPFHFKKKKKKICWMCPSMTHVRFPAAGHDLPSVYHGDACSWAACDLCRAGIRASPMKSHWSFTF